MTARTKPVSTESILLLLCNSMKKVLSVATKSNIHFQPMVQKVSKTCLKPDIGCFSVFDGGFSGLIIINFSADAALEIYQNYMLSMGFPQEELAKYHTADEVGNTLGELMNQIVGDFQMTLEKDLMVSVSQSQPKMLVLNRDLQLSINTQMDRPQNRKVTFVTSTHRIFYLESSFEKTEFFPLIPFEKLGMTNPDDIIDNINESNQRSPANTQEETASSAEDDLLAELGI